jgi:hypothetical protein
MASDNAASYQCSFTAVPSYWRFFSTIMIIAIPHEKDVLPRHKFGQQGAHVGLVGFYTSILQTESLSKIGTCGDDHVSMCGAKGNMSLRSPAI